MSVPGAQVEPQAAKPDHGRAADRNHFTVAVKAKSNRWKAAKKRTCLKTWIRNLPR